MPVIEQWILEQLDPRKDEPLIILCDPQRMITPGALAVDGWAEENGYTAPFCHGNLALRDLYEPLRGRDDVKVLLVDRSRENSKARLFYPDLYVAAGENNCITITLHRFLVETTGDQRWPAEVNERQKAALIMDHLEGVVRAHRQLRDVSPTRFTDADLHKIMMGAALGINPFVNASVEDIRRICVDHHDRLVALDKVLPEEVLQTLRDMIQRAPKPFCWLLDRDAEAVARAFMLATIVRQHGLDHDLILPALAPELHAYQGISASFIDRYLQGDLELDTDQALRDVDSAETFLLADGDRLTSLLRDRLKLDDPQNAYQVLERERFSPLIRSLALVSLLTDLLINRKLGLHRKVVELLQTQEGDPDMIALLAGGSNWEELQACYRRAMTVMEHAAGLSKARKQLRAVDDAELTWDVFDNIWNARGANRLDYYTSDLRRQLQLGNVLPIPPDSFWPELEERWQKAGEEFRKMVDLGIAKWQHEVDGRFQDMMKAHYAEWIRQSDAPAVFTHQFLPRMLKTHWDPQSGRKAVILVFDGLRTDAWEEIVRPVLEERYEIVATRPGCAILPTETQLSRKAIAAGALPEAFVHTSESTLLENWFKTEMNIPLHLTVRKDDAEASSGISVRYASDLVDYVVFDFCDHNLHDNKQELAFIYGNTVQDIMREDVRSILRGLPPDAVIFVTSDHGISPSGNKSAMLPDAALTYPQDCKYREALACKHVRDRHPDRVIDMDARTMGINGSKALKERTFGFALFPRPGYFLQRPTSGRSPDRYSHGGLSLAECMVPMVVMGPKAATQPLVVLEDVRQTGSRSENEPLTVEIMLKPGRLAMPDTPVALSFSLAQLGSRREIVGAAARTVALSFTPKLGDITQEDRERGSVVLPLTVTLTYRDGTTTQRDSRTIELIVKLDTTRVRRRMHSGLDMLMGKRPRGAN